jgi:hypothetical protein
MLIKKTRKKDKRLKKIHTLFGLTRREKGWLLLVDFYFLLFKNEMDNMLSTLIFF